MGNSKLAIPHIYNGGSPQLTDSGRPVNMDWNTDNLLVTNDMYYSS